jgi:hypothetical protein
MDPSAIYECTWNQVKLIENADMLPGRNLFTGVASSDSIAGIASSNSIDNIAIKTVLLVLPVVLLVLAVVTVLLVLQ